MEILLKLHTILTEALNSVVCLLTAASKSLKQVTPSPGSLGGMLSEYPIVTASVRVLGAWLAEDSLTLAAEVYNLLPFLMQLCTALPVVEEDGDLLKFLLPGLCHMTADDKARPVLIGAKLPEILCGYMEQLWPLCEHSRLVDIKIPNYVLV